MFRLCFIASILAICVATSWNQCKDKPSPESVVILGCDSQPCEVIKGSTAQFKIDFISQFNVKNMTTNVVAKVFGVNVAYPLDDEQKYSCSSLMYGSYCPLYRGEDVGYIFNFFIIAAYPEIALNVEISLKDESDNTITCFNTNIQVRRAPVLI